MINPSLKYCLVALLSQDIDTQNKELETLKTTEDFSGTYLLGCMKEHYGETKESSERALEGLPDDTQQTMSTGGGQPSREKTAF